MSPKVSNQFSNALGAVSLVLLSFGCSKEPTSEQVNVNSVNQTQDLDFKRWHDSYPTKEKEQRWLSFLENKRAENNNNPKSPRESLALDFTTPFTHEIALDSLNRGTKLLGYTQEIGAYLKTISHDGSVENLTDEQIAFRKTIPLEFDPHYLDWIKNKEFSGPEYDCEEIAVGYLSNLLETKAQSLADGERCSISLVVGLIYMPEMPGKGGGHVWFKVHDKHGDFIVDSSVQSDPNDPLILSAKDDFSSHYVALTEFPIGLSRLGKTAKVTPESPVIVRLP